MHKDTRSIEKWLQAIDYRVVRVSTLPKTIRAGRVLVHNHIAHSTRTASGVNGFRAWTQKRTRKLVKCDCGWSGLAHYRVRRKHSE